MKKDCITRVEGIKVGNAQDEEKLTGCTVILAPPEGAVAGADIRGGAPGTRETALLSPEMMMDRVNAIYLGGGSAWGLDAAGGVMDFLAEKGQGFKTGGGLVPIVPGAIIYDLEAGERAWPDREMAYLAAKRASSGPVLEGSVGAGTGATVGNLGGPGKTMRGGLGTACRVLSGGGVVGALAVVNPLGEVRDPETGKVIAGIWEGGGFGNSCVELENLAQKVSPGRNTILGVVATSFELNKAEATRIAQMAHDGLARTVYPAHTMWDGDIIFTLSTGDKKGDLSLIGMVAAEVMARAIMEGVKKASHLESLPAYSSLFPGK